MEPSNTDTKSHPVQESDSNLQNDPTLDPESDDASETSEQDDPWGYALVTRPQLHQFVIRKDILIPSFL